MNKDMASKSISYLVAEKLNSLGFKSSKDGCSWVRSIGNFKDELFFDLSVNSDGSIMQHVKLAFTDKLIAKKIKAFEASVREKRNLKKINITRATCSITDWKDIYGGVDSSIWFGRIYSQDEILKIGEEYFDLINKSCDWFESVRDVECMKKNAINTGNTLSLFTYIVIDKFYNNRDINFSLNEVFSEMESKKGWSKEDLLVFCKEIDF